ncbi:hypothetical protein QPK87_04505 [Kamptonema cortianum]|nr:hypothetical protein [Kamptonema cortianum]
MKNGLRKKLICLVFLTGLALVAFGYMVGRVSVERELHGRLSDEIQRMETLGDNEWEDDISSQQVVRSLVKAGYASPKIVKHGGLEVIKARKYIRDGLFLGIWFEVWVLRDPVNQESLRSGVFIVTTSVAF